MKYPKINSLWKREYRDFKEDAKPENVNKVLKRALIEGDYACPEFAAVTQWYVQEKIDGTNIRIHLNSTADGISILDIKGRTDDSDVPKPIIEHIKRLAGGWKSNQFAIGNVWLFGEGYGGNIQAGDKYRPDQAFILFDVNVNGNWLNVGEVSNVAYYLKIPSAPIIGIMAEHEIVQFVKSRPMSVCSEKEQVIEGIVAKSGPMDRFEDGTPVMFKLKCRDF